MSCGFASLSSPVRGFHRFVQGRHLATAFNSIGIVAAGPPGLNERAVTIYFLNTLNSIPDAASVLEVFTAVDMNF